MALRVCRNGCSTVRACRQLLPGSCFNPRAEMAKNDKLHLFLSPSLDIINRFTAHFVLGVELHGLEVDLKHHVGGSC